MLTFINILIIFFILLITYQIILGDNIIEGLVNKKINKKPNNSIDTSKPNLSNKKPNLSDKKSNLSDKKPNISDKKPNISDTKKPNIPDTSKQNISDIKQTIPDTSKQTNISDIKQTNISDTSKQTNISDTSKQSYVPNDTNKQTNIPNDTSKQSYVPDTNKQTYVPIDTNNPESALILAQKNAGNIDYLKSRFNDIQGMYKQVQDLNGNVITLQEQVNGLVSAQKDYANQLTGGVDPDITGAV
jgi:hypothetical protein